MYACTRSAACSDEVSQAEGSALRKWCLIVCRRGHMQTVTWAVWAARVQHPNCRQLYSFLLLLNAATLLEVSAHRSPFLADVSGLHNIPELGAEVPSAPA